MPCKDFYHDIVVEALLQEGWIITDDPLYITYGGRDAYVDLGAERLIAATKANQKIAVEIKSFVGASDVHQLELAIGQFNLYRDILSENEPERVLYLAVPDYAYWDVFNDALGRLVIQRQRIQLIVFAVETRRITRWVQ